MIFLLTVKMSGIYNFSWSIPRILCNQPSCAPGYSTLGDLSLLVIEINQFPNGCVISVLPLCSSPSMHPFHQTECMSEESLWGKDSRMLEVDFFAFIPCVGDDPCGSIQ